MMRKYLDKLAVPNSYSNRPQIDTNISEPHVSAKPKHITCKRRTTALLQQNGYDSLDDEAEQEKTVPATQNSSCWSANEGSKLCFGDIISNQSNDNKIAHPCVMTVVLPAGCVSDHVFLSNSPYDCKFQSAFTTEAVQPTTQSRRYNVREYRKLQLNIKLGGLGPNRGPEETEVLEKQQRLKEMTQAWRRKNEQEQALLNKKHKQQHKETLKRLQVDREEAILERSTSRSATTRLWDTVRVQPVVRLVRVDQAEQERLRIQQTEALRVKTEKRNRNALVRQHRAALAKSSELERLANCQLQTLEKILTSDVALSS